MDLTSCFIKIFVTRESVSLFNSKEIWYIGASNYQNLGVTLVVNEIDMLDINYCVHNPGYHTYYDTNRWKIWDPHRRPQARHEIDYLEHTRWILKNIRTHSLTWFRSNLTNVYEERTWESFINKLDTKISNLPLNDTRVFTFPLNLRLDYKSISSLYAPSHCSSFLAFYGLLDFSEPYIVIHNFLLLFYSNL